MKMFAGGRGQCSRVLTGVLLALCVSTCLCQTCPPPGFGPVKAPFDPIKFIDSSPFYVQQQLPVSYTTRPEVQCVTAHYELIDKTNPAKGFYVRNYLNFGRPNGPALGTTGSGGPILAPIQNIFFQQRGNVTDIPGAFAVSVYFPIAGPLLDLIDFQRLTAAPLWVVAYEENPDTKLYNWAILTGGPPTVAQHGACAQVPDSLLLEYINGNGVWLFTHDPVVSDETVLKMRQKAAELGIDITQFQIVKQKGCNYEGRI
eukprot:jgi/Botrbrau1/8880/Bobra.50_2s0035.1